MLEAVIMPEMRIIAVTNQKGGVGKTTSVVNLAGALAERGKKIILMDLDPQAHLTTYMGANPADLKFTSYDVLHQRVSLGEALLDIRETMQLLGAGLDLAAAEQELVSVVGRETILRDAIAEYEGEYDYLFMDCPPSMGLLTLNALSAVKEVFIPLQPHFLSLQGLSQLLESLLLVHKRINRELQVTGLLFCMYDGRTSLSGEIVGDIEAFFSREQSADCPWRDIRIFNTRIRGNIKLAESPSYGQTIYEYAPHCHGAEDYSALADEVEAMGADKVEQASAEPVEESVTGAEVASEETIKITSSAEPEENETCPAPALEQEQTENRDSQVETPTGEMLKG
jgi:chromosome partitioning protein